MENLGNGIYELRARHGTVSYRVLFSFHGQNAVLLTCGFTKEDKIPKIELAHAAARLQEFLQDPANHYVEMEG